MPEDTVRLRPLPGYAQRSTVSPPAGGLQRWWVGLRHAAWPRPSAAADVTDGAHRVRDALQHDLQRARLACATAAEDRWAALAATIGHFAASGLPVHVVAADAQAAASAHRELSALGVTVELVEPKAPPGVRRRQYAGPAAVAEVLPWARDLLHDTATVGERPRTVQMLLERGVAGGGVESRLDRALLPGRPVLVVLDPQVTLLDGAQVPVALQAGRALPGLAPDAVVQRSIQSMLQHYRHVCGLTDRLARSEADELARDCRLPMGRGVPRWARPGWPTDTSWRWAADDDMAWALQIAWARAVVDGRTDSNVEAWFLCAHDESARSLQKRLNDFGVGGHGVRALTWADAREAAAAARPPACVQALATEWPVAPVLALQCLRRWSAPRATPAPRFDGGIVSASDRIVAAWQQVDGPQRKHAGPFAPLPAGAADRLLDWQLRERSRARRQMLQNEAGMRQLLAFAGGGAG